MRLAAAWITGVIVVALTAASAPAGPTRPVDTLLQTLRLDAARPARAATSFAFQPAASYRVVVTGAITVKGKNGYDFNASYDPFYCFAGSCTGPRAYGTGFGIAANGGALVTFLRQPFGAKVSYSASHRYAFTAKGLSGKATFTAFENRQDSTFDYSGGYVIQIFRVGDDEDEDEARVTFSARQAGLPDRHEADMIESRTVIGGKGTLKRDDVPQDVTLPLAKVTGRVVHTVKNVIKPDTRHVLEVTAAKFLWEDEKQVVSLSLAVTATNDPDCSASVGGKARTAIAVIVDDGVRSGIALKIEGCPHHDHKFTLRRKAKGEVLQVSVNAR